MSRFLLTFFLLSLQLVYAQPDATMDSLLKALAVAKEDTNKVLTLITTGQYVEYNNLEEAKFYYLQAKRLSEKLKYTMGVLKYYSNYTAVLNIQARFDSALILTKDALKIANGFGNEERIIIAQQNLSATYSYLQDYESALQYLFPSVDYFEKTKNDARLNLVYDNLGVIYRETKQYDKALEYHQKGLAIARKAGNSYDIANVLSNLGNAYTSLKKYDTALATMHESLAIAKRDNYVNIVSNVTSNIGAVLIKKGSYDSLSYYCAEGLRLSEKLGDSLSMVNNIYGLALHAFYNKNFKRSEALADTGFAMAQKRNYVEPTQLFADILSELALLKGDLKRYDYYNRLSIELSEKFFNDRMQKNVQVLDKKYETGKKETQIKELEAGKKLQELTIQQKNIFNYILIGSSLSILIIALLGFRGYRQQRQLQQKEIAELQQEKQLLATEAVLQGQEQERSRLAKDLHDGLGGMLAGIKHSFSNMKENMIMTPENLMAFQRGLDMLDTSISEFRRVAHNMMPEALQKFGLDAALKDYCTDINSSGVLKVVYQSYDADQISVNPTTSATIYRIIQELINNIIKHAAATRAVVQLNKADDKLLITVEDDGKGFDTQLLKHSGGIGWANIYSRIDYLEGKVDIHSEPNNGTSVNIEIKI